MHTATPADTAAVKILIADGSPTQAQRLRLILERQGYTVFVAAIRAAEAGQRHIPIVALTANAVKDEARRCLAQWRLTRSARSCLRTGPNWSGAGFGTSSPDAWVP